VCLGKERRIAEGTQPAWMVTGTQAWCGVTRWKLVPETGICITTSELPASLPEGAWEQIKIHVNVDCLGQGTAGGVFVRVDILERVTWARRLFAFCPCVCTCPLQLGRENCDLPSRKAKLFSWFRPG